jgi:potassium-dependent mechanosensitive channel
MATLEARADLEEGVRAAAVDYYKQALDQLAKTQEQIARGAEHTRVTNQAPQLLEGTREKLSAPPASPDVSAPESATVAQIEQLRAGAEAELTTLRELVEKLRAESTRRAERQSLVSEQIARAGHALDAISDELKAPPSETEAPEVSTARLVQAKARRSALRVEVATLEKELASYEARRELLPARIDWALRRESVAEKAVAAWQSLAAERRRVEAEQAARDAEKRLREEAAAKVPQLLELAVENQRLAAVRAGEDGLSARLATVGTELSAAKERLARLRESFRRVRRKARVAGLTNAMGQLLRKRLEELPSASALRRGSALRQDQISDVQYKLILREEERAEAGDVERRLEATLAPLAPQERTRIQGVVRELLTTRRDLLDALIRDSTLIFNRLVDLDQTDRLLIEGTQEYRSYLEERILWVRSVSGSAVPSPPDALRAVGWLLGAGAWPEAVRTTGREFKRLTLEGVTWILLVVLLVALYPWCKRAAARTAESIWKPGNDAFPHTLKALLLSLVMALPLPLLVWGVGWWLAAPADQVKIGLAVGAGFKQAAMALLALELMRQVLRDRGLGDVHFRWRSTGIKHLRLHLRWFIPTVFFTTLVVESLDAAHDPSHSESLGRVAFLVGVLALAVFVQRVLRPAGPVFAIYLQRNKGGWIDRARYLWYPLGVGLPLVLGLLAIQGYYYSAQHLFVRLQTSLWLVLCLILVNALLLRWLRLTRSRLVLQQIATQEAAAVAAEAARKSAAEAAAAKAAEDAAKAAEEAGGSELTGAADSPTINSLDVPTPRASGGVRSTGRLRKDAVTHARIMAAQQRETRGGGESALLLDFEEEIDHAAISTQLQRLFRAVTALTVMLGLLVIWADVMPALKRLDQVQVWPSFSYVDASAEERQYTLDERDPVAGEESEAAGPSSAEPLGGMPALPTGTAPAKASSIPARVSLADVVLALIIFMFTIMATKNVPGLLEFLLLERVAMDAGSRYAFSTIASYMIVFVGITAGFGVVGFRWDSVQWLAAALTFGLAFGLQAIFANFVSGLIILFERPVSLGDWVTVDDVTGIVTRIRIRATTITDLDRRELIVPNKAFVTGNIVNWALSDSILRLVLPVGVAYGSDTTKTRDLLLKIAKANPRVLDDPAPRGLFRSFGADSLEFELHAYVDHPIQAWDVRHELLEAINAEFAAGGLEIAFPQHDLHLRSADPDVLKQLGAVATTRAKADET